MCYEYDEYGHGAVEIVQEMGFVYHANRYASPHQACIDIKSAGGNFMDGGVRDAQVRSHQDGHTCARNQEPINIKIPERKLVSTNQAGDGLTDCMWAQIMSSV